MKQLGKVLNKTSWAQASNTINTNSESVFSAVTMLENAAFKHKGYFLTSEEVEQLYPSAEEGSQAFVYNSSNPSTAPYDIYQMIGGTWVDTGLNGGSVSVDLTKKQDTLVGYSESVSGGKATQVAIQGDTIALSGKVSLGNVDDIESAILMSSSQAGAAIAKANTLEQSMNAIKSPVKPIHLNSQGKLELNIGKGLYVEDGKLCTTGASGGGGGGTTLSEGAGISILNNKISVAYNMETLGIDSCGGLTVNYGEGLTIKNGKLSAQASVNAGNGLVKKGDALQVSVGTGLLVADDVYVNMGKGLATDNENKVNVNLDEQTLTTDSSGKVIVNKDSLIGNGLKQEYNKLAVNYGAGLTLSNKAIAVKYGSGLDINSCGKLYVKDAAGGKTYMGGDGISITGSTINVTENILNLSTRVYELGDFASSGAAENRAKEASISGDNAIVIMRYTVSSAKKQGVILQQVGDYRTVQYQLWDGGIYTRYVWFTDNTRQTLNNGLNANEKWWKLGATHTNYDSSTRKIHLANKDDSNINANDSAVIPIVSSSVAGLMSSNMLNTLNDAQSKLVRYTEGMSGDKSTASINATEISMSGSSLKLHNVVRVCGAVFSDLQTQGNINIKGKSVIASNIDAGELKVLNGASNYGFIARTVDNPSDPYGLMLVELLSTDGYSSYKYTFPAKSGDVALKSDLASKQNTLTYGTGISISGNTITVNYGTGLSVSGGKLYSTVQSKTYVSGHAINVNNNNEINVKYDGVTISTKDTADNSLHVMLSSGLRQGTSGVEVAYGTGLAMGSDNKLYATVEGKTYTAGSGVSISSDNAVSVNYGTALGISNSKVCLKYSTSYLSLDNAGFLTINIENLKAALGI